MAHSDHMNRTTSDTRIVTKSIPPSRKLMAMNGAIAAKSVASFTPCARSFPITTRRGESAVSVISSSVCSIRSLRSALNAPKGTTTMPRNVKQIISAMKVPLPGGAASAERVRGAEERDRQPGQQAGAEGIAEFLPAHDLADLFDDDRAEAIARGVEPAEERARPAHCTRPSVISMKRSSRPALWAVNSSTGKPAAISRLTSET